MKLILTHEVTNLGAPGDIVEVKDGYGRNFLLPRNFAIRWTKGGAKQIESIKAARDAHAIHDLEEAQSIKGNLEAVLADLRKGKPAAAKTEAAATTPAATPAKVEGEKVSEPIRFRSAYTPK